MSITPVLLAELPDLGEVSIDGRSVARRLPDCRCGNSCAISHLTGLVWHAFPLCHEFEVKSEDDFVVWLLEKP